MFTGIVETMGRVARLAPRKGGALLTIETPKPLRKIAIGESIALSGACMTVVRAAGRRFTVEVSPESLRRTTLGRVAVGDAVNVERALRVGDRLGGHVVQGHVDGVGRLREIVPDAEWSLYRFTAPASVAPYLVEKGSIAVDGVSLTAFAVGEEGFSVSLIPQTRARTTLGTMAPGSVVNLEVDVLAKYVEKLVSR
jgi:riboflavin synthase